VEKTPRWFEMNVRGFEPTDLDRCRSLWAEMTQRHRDIYEDPSIGGDDPGLEFDGHLSRVGPDRIWVATSAEEIVGLVSLIQDGEQAEVEPIVVSSRHRGRGIGRELLSYAVEQAQRLGVICLSVKPVARNEEGISFFHAAGFKILGHIQLFMWLGPSSPGQWRPGPELFGKTFDY
jgi:GNAT superfamily N-acetyltransferase